MRENLEIFGHRAIRSGPADSCTEIGLGLLAVAASEECGGPHPPILTSLQLWN